MTTPEATRPTRTLDDVMADPPEPEVLDETPYTGQPELSALAGARLSHLPGAEKSSSITQRGNGEAFAESQSWTVVGAFEDLDVSAIKLSPWNRHRAEPCLRCGSPSRLFLVQV